MATILTFPTRKTTPACSLTRPECDAVHAMVDDLIASGFASAIGIQNGGQYICIHDQDGAPYYIGREDGVCSAYNSDETMISQSTRFAHVLNALEVAMMGIVTVDVPLPMNVPRPMPEPALRLVQ